MSCPALQAILGFCSVETRAKAVAWFSIIFHSTALIVSCSTSAISLPLNEGDDWTINHHNFTALITLPVILSSMLVLIGLKKRKSWYLFPYLVVAGIKWALALILYMLCFVFIMTYNPIFIIFASLLVLNLCVKAYFWLWIYSVYRIIESAENDGDVVASGSA